MVLVKNPQNKDFILSQRFHLAQDILLIPAKIFLVISGVILVVEYISSYYKSVFFDKGHRIREVGLIDNSFNEKKNSKL